MSVSLVLVTHSEVLARGVQILLAQMAPDIRVVAAGGMDDGSFGTSVDLVLDALVEATSREGTIVLGDIGTAMLTARAAIDCRGGSAESFALVDAPLVEGAVAAAVAAQGGGALADVVKAARQAGRLMDSDIETEGARAQLAEPAEVIHRSLLLREEVGLHARPAAMVARCASDYDAEVTVNGVDGRSVLELMQLGLIAGDRVSLRAWGPQADDVIEALSTMFADGFEAH